MIDSNIILFTTALCSFRLLVKLDCSCNCLVHSPSLLMPLVQHRVIQQLQTRRNSHCSYFLLNAAHTPTFALPPRKHGKDPICFGEAMLWTVSHPLPFQATESCRHSSYRVLLLCLFRTLSTLPICYLHSGDLSSTLL